MENLNVTIFMVLVALVVVLGVIFELLPDRVICRLILKRWQMTGEIPQATIKRAISVDEYGRTVYKYDTYRAMSCFYDDIVSIDLSFWNRKVDLETFESFLIERGMAYAPQERGAIIITI